MFITFYSYKGGVGRSLALANMACLLAQDEEHPQRVLLWDFDLEAPGLHRLFPPPDPKTSGFVDFVYEYATTQKMPDLSDYIYQSRVRGIDILGAGSVSGEYCERLQAIDWPKLFGDDPASAGPFFSDVLAKIQARNYDYVFVDSRTGLNDQAGICTQILSDLIVIVFRLTEQNLDGLEHVVPTMRAQLKVRHKEHVAIVPIASQIASSWAIDLRERRDRSLRVFDVGELDFIRFDPDLVADEALFCLKSQAHARWPTPSIIEDYVRLCDLLRQRNPKDTKTELGLLQGRMEAQDTASALPMLRRLLARRPRIGHLWQFLQTCTQTAPKQAEEFDNVVDGVLEKDPANPFALEWKATRCLARAGEVVEDESLLQARDYLQEAISHSQGNLEKARLHRRLAHVHSCRGDLESCAAALRNCQAMSPQNVQVSLDLAGVHIRRGANYFGSAIDELESLPKGPEAEEDKRLFLVYLRAFMGDSAASEEEFKAYVATKPSPHWKQLVDAHRRLNQREIDQAKKIAEEACDSEGDSGEVANWCEFWVCACDYDGAIALAQHGSVQDQGTEHPIVVLARFLKGDENLTRDEVLRSLQNKSWSWQFRELLFFRERVREGATPEFVDRLNIIEELIQQQDRTSSSLGGVSSLALRALRSLSSRIRSGLAALIAGERRMDVPLRQT